MGNAKSIANSIIFPAPQPSYDHNLPDLIWIPKRFAGKYSNGDKVSSGSFPVLFIRSPKPSSLFFIYLHANCCDIGLIKPELYDISEGVGASIVAVEYPGYGISPEMQVTTGPSVDLRVIATFYFLLSLGIQPNSIVFFGRSIGTGPAACVASYFVQKGIGCGGVILQAPYISIHKIVQEYFPLGSWIIDNFWDIEHSLKEMEPSVPLLIIHGLLDEIVPVSHGQKLFDSYNSENKMADFQPNSKHNYYSIREDLIIPIKKFIDQFNISKDESPIEINLPNWCYFNPKMLVKKKKSIHSDKSSSTQRSSRSLFSLSSTISENVTSINTSPEEVLRSKDSSKYMSSSRSLLSSIGPYPTPKLVYSNTTNEPTITDTDSSPGNLADDMSNLSINELGQDVNRNICYNNFSSSLEGLCQRNSINQDDISDIVNEAITRSNSSN